MELTITGEWKRPLPEDVLHLEVGNYTAIAHDKGDVIEWSAKRAGVEFASGVTDDIVDAQDAAETAIRADTA
jgi:hypothetical protein